MTTIERSLIWPEPGLKKKKKLRVIEGLCPGGGLGFECGGDIYVDYKHGRLWKCIKCSRVFPPSFFPLELKKIKSKRWAAQYHGEYIMVRGRLCQARAVTDNKGRGEIMAYTTKIYLSRPGIKQHPRPWSAGVVGAVFHLPHSSHITLAKLKFIIIAKMKGELPEAVGIEENREIIESWLK